MGYKSYAQQKAVWADRKDGGKGHPDKKKGSPAKNNHNGRMKFDPANRKRVEAMPQKTKDSLQAEAWKNDGPFYSPKYQVNVDPEDGVLVNRPIYSDGTMLTYPSLSKPVKRKTPLNHCASDMMHSGGWQEMRKHNSPGTTGNKAGIKHNEKIREEIGTFKMPHSPLNKGHKKLDYTPGPPAKDSLGKDEAWSKWEKGYMDRKSKTSMRRVDGKMEKYEKPITPEQNKKEMESERGEFKYDAQRGQIRLRKTDDADQPIERKSSVSQTKNKAIVQKTTIDKKTGKKTISKPKQLSTKKITKEEFFGSSKKKDAKNRGVSIGVIEGLTTSPLNKEGKKDACYHKVKSRVKVWPSAYASGQLVQCRKAGAANWGEKSKKK